MVSSFWPDFGNNGMAHATASHLQMLSDLNCKVSVIAPEVNFPLVKKNFDLYKIRATGTGSIYSPSIVNTSKMFKILSMVKPELIIIEGWQHALGHAAIRVGSKLGIKVLMVSHGISIHPYSFNIKNYFRYICWLPFSIFSLKSLIRKIDILIVLKKSKDSHRFYDYKIALENHVCIKEIPNAVKNNVTTIYGLNERKQNIIVIGYFSQIKNQLFALEVLKQLSHNIDLIFVGSKKGTYYNRCLNYVKRNNLSSNVKFFEDSEFDIQKGLQECILLLNTSITEVQPISIIEAISYGTPFIAKNNGVVKSISGGIVIDDFNTNKFCSSIENLLSNKNIWNTLSAQGRKEFEEKYSYEKNIEIFSDAILT